MTTFQINRDERTIDFKVTTTEAVMSFRGTAFVPNHCAVRIFNGAIVSLILEKLDENGWGMDDPAGPDGAELNTGFGGGEIGSVGRPGLPQVARDALAEVEKLI